MQISMYEILVPTANRMLGNLSNLLDKGAAFAEAKKFDAAVLLNARLAPDMFVLTRQVQIACDMVKGAAARLSGTEIPKFEDTETTIAELKARIARTLAFVNSVDAAKFAGSEDRDIVLLVRGTERRLKGLNYLRDYVLPNMYFHVTTTYAILRHNGVELGKPDFIGAL
ncbi:MAG TPA: DUF1993 family protein [Rudaea sp.]|nr:DUF1993 family protein [Rudaea sp.]